MIPGRIQIDEFHDEEITASYNDGLRDKMPVTSSLQVWTHYYIDKMHQQDVTGLDAETNAHLLMIFDYIPTGKVYGVPFAAPSLCNVYCSIWISLCPALC